MLKMAAAFATEAASSVNTKLSIFYISWYKSEVR